MYNREDLFGSEITREYKDIMPLIDLVVYRAGLKNYDGLFSYDEFVRTDSASQVIKSFLRRAGYMQMCLSGLFRSQSGKALISDTLLSSDRYSDLARCLATEYNITGILQTQNISLNRQDRALKKSVDKNRLFHAGKSLCGSKLKQSVSILYDYLVKGFETNENPDPTEIRIILDVLRKRYKERIKFVRHLLKKNGIQLFITVNEYNLRDRLIICACHECGIYTKELSHNANLIIDLDYFKRSDAIMKTIESCVDERCMWNEYEVEFARKYISDKVNYSTAGCPEILKKPECIKEDVVTLMVPVRRPLLISLGIEDDGISTDAEWDYKKKLFEALRIFADKNGLKVWLRYHPADNTLTRSKDKELAQQLGFIILDDSREAFEKAVTQSRAVVGFESSALIVAAYYDCNVFSISNGEFDYCGFPIKHVSVEELGDSRIDAGYKYSGPVEINIEKLLTCSI